MIYAINKEDMSDWRSEVDHSVPQLENSFQGFIDFFKRAEQAYAQLSEEFEKNENSEYVFVCILQRKLPSKVLRGCWSSKNYLDFKKGVKRACTRIDWVDFVVEKIRNYEPKDDFDLFDIYYDLSDLIEELMMIYKFEGYSAQETEKFLQSSYNSLFKRNINFLSEPYKQMALNENFQTVDELLKFLRKSAIDKLRKQEDKQIIEEANNKIQHSERDSDEEVKEKINNEKMKKCNRSRKICRQKYVKPSAGENYKNKRMLKQQTQQNEVNKGTNHLLNSKINYSTLNKMDFAEEEVEHLREEYYEEVYAMESSTRENYDRNVLSCTIHEVFESSTVRQEKTTEEDNCEDFWDFLEEISFKDEANYWEKIVNAAEIHYYECFQEHFVELYELEVNEKKDFNYFAQLILNVQFNSKNEEDYCKMMEILVTIVNILYEECFEFTDIEKKNVDYAEKTSENNSELEVMKNASKCKRKKKRKKKNNNKMTSTVYEQDFKIIKANESMNDGNDQCIKEIEMEKITLSIKNYHEELTTVNNATNADELNYYHENIRNCKVFTISYQIFDNFDKKFSYKYEKLCSKRKIEFKKIIIMLVIMMADSQDFLRMNTFFMFLIWLSIRWRETHFKSIVYKTIANIMMIKTTNETYIMI